MFSFFPKRRIGIHVSLSENVEGSVELNQNTICVNGSSKGPISGMTEYTTFELSGKAKGDDQLT
jgi:ribonuclease PH